MTSKGRQYRYLNLMGEIARNRVEVLVSSLQHKRMSPTDWSACSFRLCLSYMPVSRATLDLLGRQPCFKGAEHQVDWLTFSARLLRCPPAQSDTTNPFSTPFSPQPFARSFHPGFAIGVTALGAVGVLRVGGGGGGGADMASLYGCGRIVGTTAAEGIRTGPTILSR
jgi:hypothetical protein